MKILITGGAGYIGSGLLSALAKRYEVTQIVIYDNLSRKNHNIFFSEKSQVPIRFIRGELLDSRSLRKALKDIDVVYHLAARVFTPLSDEDPHLFDQVNHWGTAELSYALEESNVKKLIYLSTTAVYPSSEDMITHETQARPTTHYAISKYNGERMLERLHKKMDTLIMRCGNVYGYAPAIRFDAVVNRFAFEARFHKKIRIHHDGSQWRSFIHIDKVSEALAQLSSAELSSGTYNLTDINMQVSEVAEAFRIQDEDLEMLYITQELPLKSWKVERDARLEALNLFEQTDFENDIKVFIERFSF